MGITVQVYFSPILCCFCVSITVKHFELHLSLLTGALQMKFDRVIDKLIVKTLQAWVFTASLFLLQ